MNDLQKQIFAAAWLAVADERHLEITCADIINKFDHEVLEATAKRFDFQKLYRLQLSLLLQLRPQHLDRKHPSGSKVNNDSTIPPTLVYKMEPEYSEEALKAKFQATVVVFVEIDSTGHVVNPRVLRPVGLGLDEKAIEAAKKWQFTPALKDANQCRSVCRLSSISALEEVSWVCAFAIKALATLPARANSGVSLIRNQK